MPRPMDDDDHPQRHHPPPPPPSSAAPPPPPPPPPPLHRQLNPPPPLPAPFNLSLPLHLSHNPPPQPPYTLSATQPPHPSNPPDRPSRDDCWSPGATQTLIDAWGTRFLDLNRGNLKQKHWKEVADAVNRREGGSKVPKTDVQCKNRLDTLKKKYKMEKSKIVIGGAPSKWSFFDRLDDLTGPCKKQKKLAPLDEQKTDDHKRPAEEPDQQPPSFAAVNCNRNVATDNNSESKESPDMTDSCPRAFDSTPAAENLKRRRLYESPFKDLERAILRFGEVYERIEIAKQQHMMDLEKRRMEFAKDLEVQRMQLFMQAQLELAKFKHGKHSSTEHYL